MYDELPNIIPNTSPQLHKTIFHHSVPRPIYKTATMNPAKTAANPRSTLPAAPLGLGTLAEPVVLVTGLGVPVALEVEVEVAVPFVLMRPPVDMGAVPFPLL